MVLPELLALRQVFNPSNGRSRPARVVRPVIIVVIAGPPGGPTTIIKCATTCQPGSDMLLSLPAATAVVVLASAPSRCMGRLKHLLVSMLCEGPTLRHQPAAISPWASPSGASAARLQVVCYHRHKCCCGCSNYYGGGSPGSPSGGGSPAPPGPPVNNDNLFVG